jgi:hypothetical protein
MITASALFKGQCHCGNIELDLVWPEGSSEIPARECRCSFCVKHGGVWTSNPGATLSVVLRRPDLLSKYEFGTQTATFYICARCGAVPFVTSEIAGHLYAVVNVNALENLDSARLSRGTFNVDGEGGRVPVG